MSDTKVDPRVEALEREVADLRQIRKGLEHNLAHLRGQFVDKTHECSVLEDQLRGTELPSASSWLQQKVWRQRKALERLNQRVFNQRVFLRLMNELGRIPTREEFFDYLEVLDPEVCAKIWGSVTE